jgi:8-hydroxy-5-deazaflavin:NADPH oxidoreductase
MKIGILGTGGVGKAFAARLTELGHEVMLGTRDAQATLSKKENGIVDLLNQNAKISLGSFSEASQFGEMIINVAKGSSAIDVIKLAGEKNISGKILIDITNPLDFSKGMPPSLIPELSNTNSLGEEIQRMLPQAKVVKTLNTMWNGLMLNPKLVANGQHINYICGNDAEAKKKVRELLYQFGWEEKNILDLGDITAARATEATLPIWLRVYGAKQSGAFNFQVVS